MRIDLYLTKNGYADSRTRAQHLIAAGLVRMDGKAVRRPSEDVDESLHHQLEVGQDIPYVGRGGCKLEAALDAFGLDVTGAWALDIGASTGGFTDCLLRRGAERVYAVDSGSGQLAASLRADERVVNIEKCNARHLNATHLDEPFAAHGGADLVVMDVSFISQTCILPVLPSLLKADGRIVTLIKPQFEVGREGIGKGGIVREDKWRRAAVERVTEGAALVGLSPVDVIRSPIEGGDGNVEYLCCLTLTDAQAAETARCALMARLPTELFRK